ncbi:MAG: peroxide stress protein YaaA [Saprospiraceae bacterium]
MLFLISPAKSLDYSPTKLKKDSLPRLIPQTEELVTNLRQKSVGEIKELMKISDKLAELNTERYRVFSKEFDKDNSKQAILAFKGDVYQGMETEDYTTADFNYAQKYLRILSGLYGVLKPLDRIQPYRLEMGTKLTTEKGRNLYHYWDDTITNLVNEDLEGNGKNVIVNLASNEYFKSIQKKKLNGRLLTINFKDEKNGQYKVISFFAKKARGMMCRFAIKNKIKNPEHLKGFDLGGYAFNEELSEENDWVFTR